MTEPTDPTLLDSEIDTIFQRLDKKIANGITLSIIRDEVFDTDPIINVAKSDIKALIATEVIKELKALDFNRSDSWGKYLLPEDIEARIAKLRELINGR